MYDNPFTPVFGGKPELFFGRTGILHRFGIALVDRGAEERVLFITGTRGSGKTALLEQLTRKAEASGRRVIDLGPEHVMNTLMRRLVRNDSVTKVIDPRVSINVLGSGGSVGGVSTARTTTYPPEDLPIVFAEACEREQRGILVTIDEIQKVALEEVSAICNAFQLASRKGHDIMLAVAGLPYAHEDIIRYPSCTYMRRAVHEELGLLGRVEVENACLRR